MGIDGTPTFLLGMADPNVEVVKIEQTLVGASPYDTFRSSIDDLLAGKKDHRN
jgi:hypothetical protein